MKLKTPLEALIWAREELDEWYRDYDYWVPSKEYPERFREFDKIIAELTLAGDYDVGC